MENPPSHRTFEPRPPSPDESPNDLGPKSRSTQSNEISEGRPSVAISGPVPRQTPYLDYIRALSDRMPHLGIVLGRYRHQEQGTVQVISPHHGDIAEAGVGYKDDSHGAISTNLKNIWGNSPAGTAFIVEDLCPNLVDIIGDVFHRPHPEIFAEHLHRSGHKPNRALEESPDQWVTAGFRKPFASINWFRPVFLDDENYEKHTNQSLRDVSYPEQEEGTDQDESLDGEDDLYQRTWPIRPYRQKDPKSIPKTNIYRGGVSLGVETTDTTSSDPPFLWEEKATVLMPNEKQEGKVLILLDPLPYIQREYVWLPYTAARLHRHPSPMLPDIDSPNIGMLPVIYSLNIGMLSKRRETNSTAHDLGITMRSRDNEARINEVVDPVKSLLKIVYQDVGDSFDLIEASLEHITSLSMDDYRLQISLDTWRLQLALFQKEVRKVLESLQQFAKTFYGPSLPHDVDCSLQEIEKKAKLLLKKIASCQSGLRADMNLLESRRGIAEAESVTRLTELAFIFIPLSFVSSLFSMQVNELSSRVPTSSFVAAGSIVLIIIYGLRLAIRARSAVRLRNFVVVKARIYNKLKPSDPIPTTGFLLFCCDAFLAGVVAMARFSFKYIVWGGGRTWGVWLSFTAVALTAVPVVWLWLQSGFDVSFKATGTIIFAPAGLLFTWVLASIWYNIAGWSLRILLKRTFEIIRRHYRIPNTSAVRSASDVTSV